MLEGLSLITKNLPESSDAKSDLDALTLQLYTEEPSVSRRSHTGEIVRVSTVTHSHERLIDEELTHERVEIERVPIGRHIASTPPVRQEGDVMIISVVEEHVVVERRLVLKEEIRIRRVRVTEHHRETVMVREQEAAITRTRPEPPVGESGPPPEETIPTLFAQEQQ